MTVAVATLAKETTTTTGTGSYALLGAATNFNAFSSQITPSATALVFYTARMEEEFEQGVGLLSASTTLQRIKVVKSSNANAAVNWGAGSKEVYCDALAGSALGRNRIHTAKPVDATDNYTEGYVEGSWWIVQNGSDENDVYLCTDAGVPGATAATWVLAGTHALTRMAGAYSISVGYNDNSSPEDGVVAVGIGALGLWAMSTVHGHGGPAHGDAQTIQHGLYVQTTDATPTKLLEPWDGNTYLPIPQDWSGLIEVLVVARDNTTPDSKSWRGLVHVDRAGTADPVLVDYAAPTAIGETGGAAAWAVAVGIDTTNDGLYIEATGAAAKTIRWTASLRVVAAGF